MACHLRLFLIATANGSINKAMCILLLTPKPKVLLLVCTYISLPVYENNLLKENIFEMLPYFQLFP
jgi:hypothetical protein